MLLLWAALFLLVSANDYIRYRHMDAPEHDLVSVSVSDIDELKQLCNAVKECKGFNSRGILKTNVSFPSYTNTSTDLYVKLKNPAGPNPNIWPFPQQFTQGNLNVTINPATFAFIAQPSFNDIQNAFVWFRSLIFTHPVGTPTVGPFLPSLTVQVSQPYVQLQNGIDESYILDIPSDGSGATLKATTYYGAVNGLQTFSQLVVFDFASHSYQIRLAPWLVQDAPRYPHRGMLIDTSRHFQPVSVLLKVIDSLSFAKFNVLHWHLSDSQSFPFESRTYPNLWAGSYSEQERYTQEDVQEVVEYARQRNVRTMVEFDTPGHAASWCAGYMNVCPSPSCLEPLNPATEDTFNLIESLFGECTGGKTAAGLFPENFFHLGGDEVDTTCWSSTPSIQQWMTANNFTTDDAYYYFINRSMTYAIADGRIPVNWEEVYDHFGKELAPQAVVHAWFDKTTVSAAVADGYHALNSDGWYLDHLDDLWQTYYNNDPMENITVPAQQALVYGGEACMWGETVDPSDIFNTIWPRAAAVAERLWSPANIDDTALALPRYEWFRCFMTRRGINAAPSNNAEARQPPPNPGSCLVQ